MVADKTGLATSSHQNVTESALLIHAANFIVAVDQGDEAMMNCIRRLYKLPQGLFERLSNEWPLDISCRPNTIDPAKLAQLANA